MSEHEPTAPPRSKLRQRLVGALVVVALAVLLLPLWLDGGGLKTTEVQPIPTPPPVAQPADINIPAPSAAQITQLQTPPTSALPAQEPTASAPQSIEPAPAVVKIPAQVNAAEIKNPPAKSAEFKPSDIKPAESQPIEPKPTVKSTPDKPATLAPAVKPAPAIQEQKKEPIQTTRPEVPANTVKPNLAEPSKEGEWVVQLGSFSDELNARGLAKSVSDAGFKVEVSPLFAKKGTVWRVRVGPYATRDQATKTTIQLRERLGRDGLVMPK